MTAKFIGVGVGPGDPELMTLKAARLIQAAEAISYLCNEQGHSQAKQIASPILEELAKKQKSNHSQIEIPINMPMSTERSLANEAYDQAASRINQLISTGKNVVFLCEGDPLFFGSFAYLLERLQQLGVECEVVPGISSVHAASSALQLPLTMLKESFAVVSGRHSLEQLVSTLISHDSVVIMKAGRSRQKIIRALSQSQRKKDAKYLEYIGRNNEFICHDMDQLNDESGPYFSLFVIVPQQNRFDQ